MICKNNKELLAEIQKHMILNNIQMKDIAVMLRKSPQSISQIFQVGNPRLSTLFEICNVLGIKIDLKYECDTK